MRMKGTRHSYALTITVVIVHAHCGDDNANLGLPSCWELDSPDG